MEYFLWSLYITLLMIIGAAISAVIPMLMWNSEVSIWISSIFMILVYIALIVPWLSLSVRRFHDLNKSGWWVLSLFVPIVSFFMALYLLFWAGDPNSQYKTDKKEWEAEEKKEEVKEEKKADY